MPVVPGGLHEEPPDVAVARLGDAAAPFPVPGGGFTRDEADVGHAPPRVAEALEVPDLDQDRQGPEGIEAPEAAEPADGLAVGGLL